MLCDGKQVVPHELASTTDLASGNCQDFGHTDCLELSSIDTRLRAIIEQWPHLSEHERDRIAGYLDGLASH